MSGKGAVSGRSLCSFLLGRLVNRCLLCNAPLPHRASQLCARCSPLLEFRSSGFCPMCGRVYTADHAVYLCGKCRRKTFPWARLGFYASYTGVLKEILQEFKFGAKLEWSGLLTLLMGRAIEFHFPSHTFDAIVPVPLHPERLRKRGMNQSLQLAWMVSRELQTKVYPRGLKRIRATPPQSTLSRKERLENVKNVFAPSMEFSGQHVLLVDDVITTGSTLAACARTILQAGAERVSALVVAVSE